MNINNAKKIVSNPPGLKIFENFRADIICTHTTPNTHANTKLWRRKNGKLIPLIINNPNGMEDPHEVVRGSNRLMACEIKDIGGEQWSTGIFKSTDGINYTQTDTLKPTSNHWEKDSVSSPTFYDDDTDNIPILYEGRYRENWDDFKTGIADVNFETGKITYRSNNPILDDRLVPDDIWFKNGWYWYSFHTRSDSLGWYALLYKSEIFNHKLIFDSNITYKGEKILSYYKDKTFGWKNYVGIWQVIPDKPQPPTNGGNVKPITKIENDILKCETVTGASHYHWQCSLKPGNPYFDSGQELPIPNNFKVDGAEFWCGVVVDGKRTDLERVIYENDIIEPPIEDPPTSGFDIAKIREHAQAILDLTE